MRIRPMQTDELAMVAAIERDATRFPWPLSQFESGLAAGHIFTVLELDNRLLGFSIFSRVLDEASLLNLVVSPIVQGKGLGRRLLVSGLAEQTAAGALSCFLEVRVSNLRAQSLYQSLGFTVVGQRKKYYPAVRGREDGLLMSCPLPLSVETSIETNV